MDNDTYIYVEKEITYEEINRQKLFNKKIKVSHKYTSTNIIIISFLSNLIYINNKILE